MEAVWYAEKTTRLENQETWVSSPDSASVGIWKGQQEPETRCLSRLAEELGLYPVHWGTKGSDQTFCVFFFFFLKLFGNSVEGGLKEKNWIGDEEMS